MKKILVCFLFVFIFIGVVSATDNYSSVATMIDKKLAPQTVNEIQKLSSSLTGEEKSLLYMQNQCQTTTPFVLNLLLGCGIGSYVQGDSRHGTIFLASELAAAGFIVWGELEALNYATDVAINGYSDKSESAGLGLIIAGGAAMLGIRIWECIQPFTYAKSYNQRLNAALNGGAPSIAFVPTYKNGSMGASLVASINF